MDQNGKRGNLLFPFLSLTCLQSMLPPQTFFQCSQNAILPLSFFFRGSAFSSSKSSCLFRTFFFSTGASSDQTNGFLSLPFLPHCCPFARFSLLLFSSRTVSFSFLVFFVHQPSLYLVHRPNRSYALSC